MSGLCLNLPKNPKSNICRLAADARSGVPVEWCLFLAAGLELGLLIRRVAVGLAGAVKKEKIVTARNIARNSQVLPGHRRVKAPRGMVTIQEPTGPTTYLNHTTDQVVGCRLPSGGAVYISRQPVGGLAEIPFMPPDLAEAFQELPAEALPVLAGLCTIFVEQVDKITCSYHQKNPGMTHGVVKTTLRHLAEQIGLSNAGKNLQMLAKVLGVMTFTHVQDFVVGEKRTVEPKGQKKEKKVEELRLAVGRFITWLDYRWRKDEPFSEATVGVTLCPALTDFLLSPECWSQMVWVPVEALRKLRLSRRRSRYSIPLFFFLMAACPGKGKAFRIGWEKAAERAGIPSETESGRRKRPGEKKELVRRIMRDIAETGALHVTEKDGVYTVRYSHAPAATSEPQAGTEVAWPPASSDVTANL